MNAESSSHPPQFPAPFDLNQLRLLQSRIELLSNDLTKASERLAVISAHVMLLLANAQGLR